MKKIVLMLLILLISSTFLFSQSSQIVDDSFYSPSLERNIALKIYLPPNYSTANDPYRVYVFLHGGGSSTYSSHIGTISSTLDNLINNPTLNFKPFVVVCANITWSGLGGGVNWMNLHNYYDSYLTGSYESVICEDLMNWINSCSYNLSPVREQHAIGGFSMGGNCVRIALKNSDKFCAFTSHGGYPSIKALEGEVSFLLSQYSSGPPYQFSPQNDYFSMWWFAHSAALSPDTLNPNQPNWQVDFPINTEGVLIPEIYDSIWVKHNDPTSIIQNPQIYTDTVHIYFDVRIGDVNKFFNDSLHAGLNSLNIDHVYKIFPTGGHQYSTDQAESGFMFLDSIMDALDQMVPAFANNINLNHSFLNKGIDTLVFTANLNNPNNHNIELYAMFESLDGSFIDSLMMYDDGLHNDSAALDGIYGNSMLAPIEEHEFMVGLKTRDLDFIVTTLLEDLERFTTIGPLSVNNCNEIMRVSNFIFYEIELLNNGSTAAAQNVNANISISDPYVTVVLNSSQEFGTIDAGQTATSSGNFRVATNNLPSNHTFNFYVEIFSNNHLFWTDSSTVVVGITDASDHTPQVFSLNQNYPNPFNPTTKIKYTLPKSETVKIEVYNLLGQKIQTLLDKQMPAGSHEVEFTDHDLPSAVYLYRIQAGKYQDVRKMILLQ